MSQLSIPTLHTPRLTLRAPARTDFDACQAMWSHHDVTRFISGRASTGEEVWARLLRYIGHWAVFGYGFWIIEDQATGVLMGETGFGDFHREMEPSFGDTPEMGWVLAPGAHGRGVATEAVGAALAWADTRFAHTGCIIAPANTPSLRVAEKVGYREVQRTSYKGEPTIVFERHAPTTST